uniref:Uncharacterized protein n=1 Tax=Arundo donax TaxID=35708 RepID=A0A0A9GGK2_ARUDO
MSLFTIDSRRRRVPSSSSSP